MKSLRRARPSKLAMIGIAFVRLMVLVLIWIRSIERGQQLEIPLAWARLAPYPNTARDLRASTSGGPFTRAFRVSFSAPAADIEQWLQNSPGTQGNSPERPSANKRRFLISPGAGAQHAEVTVDDSSGVVSIYVYWS